MVNELLIKEVTSKSDVSEFIRFPERLYDGNACYIPPLRREEFKKFSDKNPALEFCRAKFWLAYRYGQIAGRIAGIINDKYNRDHGKKYARFGWIHFIEDEQVTGQLLNIVEEWARSEGMEYIHGPLGFTTFDPSGILVQGFNEIPTAFATYNYPYYAEQIEKAGYAKDMDWVEYEVKVPRNVPDRVTQISEMIKKRYGLHSATLRKSTDIMKYSEGIFHLLNTEYRDLYAFTEFNEAQKKIIFKDFITFVQPEFISIVLDSRDQVIGFGITMPSLSRMIRKASGHVWLFALYKILGMYKKTRTVDALLIAVKKEYQSKGITGLIFNDIIPALIRKGFVNFESTKELETNIRVNNLWTSYEHRQHRRIRCYIKKL